MNLRRRWVVDTNLLVSRLLLPESIPGQAFQRAIETGEILVSDSTLAELVEVLARPRFNRYLSGGDRDRFFTLLAGISVRIEIIRPVVACRDPKDDKFLEVATNGRADALLTGDQDLLALHAYLGVPILSPRQLIEQSEKT